MTSIASDLIILDYQFIFDIPSFTSCWVKFQISIKPPSVFRDDIRQWFIRRRYLDNIGCDSEIWHWQRAWLCVKESSHHTAGYNQAEMANRWCPTGRAATHQNVVQYVKQTYLTQFVFVPIALFYQEMYHSCPAEFSMGKRSYYFFRKVQIWGHTHEIFYLISYH